MMNHMCSTYTPKLISRGLTKSYRDAILPLWKLKSKLHLQNFGEKYMNLLGVSAEPRTCESFFALQIPQESKITLLSLESHA